MEELKGFFYVSTTVFLLLVTPCFAAEKIRSGYPEYLEKKLAKDIEKTLDNILGPQRYLITISLTIRQEDSQVINKTMTPLIVTGNTYAYAQVPSIQVPKPDTNDRVTASGSYGFPNFLSPSLFTLDKQAEQSELGNTEFNISKTETEHVYYNHQERIRTIPGDFVQRIKYTIIINEDDTKMPGFKKERIQRLIAAVINLDSRRGDVLEIYYEPFSDQLFEFSNLAFQLKLIGSYIALPVWVMNILIGIGLTSILFLILYRMYRTVLNIIETFANAALASANSKSKGSEDVYNETMSQEDMMRITEQEPEEIGEMLKKWVDESDQSEENL